MDMTLKEVCTMANISRRAVQGYENANLVSATGKTKQGYLLYDENAQERIKKIRLYQKLGFSIKEIQVIIDAQNDSVKLKLEEKVKKLYEQRDEIMLLIEVVNDMISKL